MPNSVFPQRRPRREDRNSTRAPGLRGQLLVGLALILVVGGASLAMITSWTWRRQLADLQLASGRQLGLGLAHVIAHAFPAWPPDRGSLQQLVADVAQGPLAELEVVDAELRVRASAAGALRLAASPAAPLEELQTAMRSGQQLVRVIEVVRGEPGGAAAVAITTPIFVAGEVRGAVRALVPLDAGSFGWPALSWVLMLLDGALVVVFVAFVLTRYVIRPLDALRAAAREVAGGDLAVRLASGGASEFASLADSFNSMTASLREKLERLEQQRLELAASREHLIRSEKLASVGRLAAGVAHEVGNPLQAIIGFDEVLLAGGLEPAEQRAFLARGRDEAQRIHRIVRELLDYARPVEDAVEAVALAAVVEQSLQLVGPQQRLREVAVERVGLDAIPPVAANAPRLVQVLVNLFLNAADAMQGRGTLYLEGRSVAGATPDGARVELRVANSGPPIPPADRGRIFDPFFTTKEPGRGTGLGLSVAQSIVESYGGRLYLDERESRTTFVIVLYPYCVSATD
jgi:signal transduction histidine kinase